MYTFRNVLAGIRMDSMSISGIKFAVESRRAHAKFHLFRHAFDDFVATFIEIQEKAYMFSYSWDRLDIFFSYKNEIQQKMETKRKIAFFFMCDIAKNSRQRMFSHPAIGFISITEDSVSF